MRGLLMLFSLLLPLLAAPLVARAQSASAPPPPPVDCGCGSASTSGGPR